MKWKGEQFKVKGVFLFLFMLLLTNGYAQRSKESLQKEINALQKDIATANKLL